MRPSHPSAFAATRVPSRYSPGRFATQAHSARFVRAAGGVRWRSNSRSRQWRISFGSGIFTGHTLSHLPQKVDAFGSRPAWSTPTSAGVSTLPIGPGYTQP